MSAYLLKSVGPRKLKQSKQYPIEIEIEIKAKAKAKAPIAASNILLLEVSPHPDILGSAAATYHIVFNTPHSPQRKEGHSRRELSKGRTQCPLHPRFDLPMDLLDYLSSSDTASSEDDDEDGEDDSFDGGGGGHEPPRKKQKTGLCGESMRLRRNPLDETDSRDQWLTATVSHYAVQCARPLVSLLICCLLEGTRAHIK